MDKFRSIGSFKEAISTVRHFCHHYHRPLPIVQCLGTVKLHGTNAGINRSPSNKIQAQAREKFIDVNSDNYGFAFFCEANKESVAKLFERFSNENNVTIFGEWCGGKIQRNVALLGLPKHFVICAIKVDDSYIDLPDDLHNNEASIYNIKQIPTYEVSVDYTRPAIASELLSDYTLAVEEECPWAKLMFNTSGIGEGIVWTNKADINDETYWFKTKGLKHKNDGETSKTAKIKISDDQLESIEAVSSEVLPEWRLEQGISHLRDNNLPLTPQSTGAYLQWIAKDIIKEEINTIAASGFDWKGIQSTVMRNARNYYLTEIDKGIDYE